MSIVGNLVSSLLLSAVIGGIVAGGTILYLAYQDCKRKDETLATCALNDIFSASASGVEDFGSTLWSLI